LEPFTFSEQLLLSYVDEAEQRDKDHQHSINNVQDSTSLVTKTPWLRYVKWMETFAGQNMKDLYDYTTLPFREDIDGTIIGDVVSEYLRDCWNGYHDCLERGWQLLPFWLNSVARDKEDTKPFRLYLTTMPRGNPAGFLSYNVWTGIRLHHEKSEIPSDS
jgi:hypothetical protein